MQIEKDIRSIEHSYYNEMEQYRLFGCDAKRIQQELDHQIGDHVHFIFLSSNKKLMANIFQQNMTATELYAALENITDESIKVNKNPDKGIIEFYTSKYGLEIEITLFVKGNKRCYWEEIGKKEVPIYELRCEED